MFVWASDGRGRMWSTHDEAAKVADAVDGRVVRCRRAPVQKPETAATISTRISVYDVATELRRRGLSVVGQQEGNDVQDGAVELSMDVHVQVPTNGGGRLGIIGQNADGTLTCYPMRPTWEALVADARKALEGKV